MLKKTALFLVLALFCVGSVRAAPPANPCSGDTATVLGQITDTAIKAGIPACVQAGMDEAMCTVLACSLSLLNSPAQNNPQWWNPSLGQFSNKVFNAPADEIFGERYTYAQVNWIINSIFTLFLPQAHKMDDVIQMLQFAASLQAGKTPEQFQPFAGVLDFPFNHPVASLKTEVQNTLAKLEIVPKVEAQGLGYSKLAGSTNINLLWTATRNMAYLIATILLIATGFLIMFRTKVNPQAVVTIQMVIPKLVISLVLITFSLAIVGFVIDMIYVSLAAIIGFLQMTGVSTNLGGNINLLLTAQTSFISNMFLWWYIVFAIVVIILMMILQTWVVQFGPMIYAILAILLGFFVWSIIAMVRIFVTLIHAYLNLVILTITGPLQIMMDVLPIGHKSGFVPWFKCVVGNASVFVITGVCAIAAQLLFNFGTSIGNSAGFFGGGGNFGWTNGLTGLGNGLKPGFSLPFINTGGDWLLGNVTQLGTTGQGFLLGAFFLPMAFFSIMPGLMVSLRNALCKTDDPTGEVTKMVDNVIKQLAGGKPKSPKDKTDWEGGFDRELIPKGQIKIPGGRSWP